MRKRDSVKPGCGIDGSEGENFTKQYANSPWSPPKLTDSINPRGAGRYTDDKPGLRNKLPAEATASSRDIFDDVSGQQSDSGSRVVKSRGW